MPTTSIILGVMSLVPSLQEHMSEWVIQWDFFPKSLWVTIILYILQGRSHQPYHPCKPSTPVMCQQLENQCSRVISEGLLRFHTHANYVHLCWKATALARRPSDSIRVFFFLNSQFSLHPFTGALRASPADSTVCVHSCCAIWARSNLLN